MSGRDSGSVNVNAELADNLREIVDFLETHPDLPAFHGYIGRYCYGAKARESMSRIAVALGDRAVESLTDNGHEVQILGEFGEARVRAYAPISNIGGRKVTPEIEYAPIIGVPVGGKR